MKALGRKVVASSTNASGMWGETLRVSREATDAQRTSEGSVLESRSGEAVSAVAEHREPFVI